MLAYKTDAPFKVASKKRKVPDSLVKETINGVPFYYKGYKQVMNKTKQLEEIMADSVLQGFLKSFLGGLLHRFLDLKKYIIMNGEIGNHIDLNNNLALDFVIFDRQHLTGKKIISKYADVPPKIVIEVDVKVEFDGNPETTFEAFILPKVKKLFDFGTEKVIWIFTKNQTVVVAYPNGDWKVSDWSKNIEIVDGIQVNILEILEEYEVDLNQ